METSHFKVIDSKQVEQAIFIFFSNWLVPIYEKIWKQYKTGVNFYQQAKVD